MTAATAARPADEAPASWAARWRLARRDMAGNLRGLRLLFVCIFLGVGTLAAIGSLVAALNGELAGRGQELLGGDVEIAMTQREATPADRAAFTRLGTLSETVRLRAMAQRVGTDPTDAPPAILTELKAVDAAYPLYGTLTLEDGRTMPRLAADELLIGRALADRLDVSVGDALKYGDAPFRIAGIIAVEPDRVGEGFTLGPVAITGMDGMRRTGLIQPGSLYEAKYRVRLPAGADAAAVADGLAAQAREQSWEITNRDRAAPGANRFFERMGQFLTLIGLTALVVAGIGVGNGVASYLAAKRTGIATLKVLGASSADIHAIYMLQIAFVTLLAVVLGLIAGAALPPLLVALAGDALPVQPGFAIHPLPLLVSAVYGMLIALAFTLPPLSRAKTEPAAALFRALVDDRGRTGWRTLAMVAAAAAGIVALALVTAREPLFSAIVLAAIAAVLVLLQLLGWAVRRGAARLPRARRPLLRLAIANLHRPGAQTAALVVALGLALTLFVLLAGIQTSLQAEIRRTVPERAPDQFVLDVPVAAAPQFRALVDGVAPGSAVNMVPALRGTIVAFKGQRVADMTELPEGAWFLRGERGVTYSATLPEGSDLVAGRWWAADHAGPPLVSLDTEAAATMGVGVGDTLTVSVLGREIEARVASLRQVNWDTMGFNYIMVFSPNALQSAPHTLAATITLADGAPAQAKARVARGLLNSLPSATIIDVGDVIGQVGTLLRQMATAILAAATVAILAGVAVLVGAIAAARRARSYDSVILKTLGATRGQILGAQALEYTLLAVLLAGIAAALGLAGGWYVITQVFDFTWAPDWPVVLGTLAGGALGTLGIGLLGSIPVLSARPAAALRDL